MSAVAVSRRLVLLGAGAAAVAPAAFAHRSQACFTSVEWNPRASTIEVVHRMHAHDAEVAIVKEVGNAATVDITDVKNQARVALYVERAFSLKAGGTAVPLGIVGAELKGDALWIYREAKWASAPGSVTVDDRLFRDVFKDQRNVVNIRMATRTRSIIFSGRDGAKTVDGLL